MKKTALYEKHLALGGKMVEFAGYSMPVQYAGVIAEHLAVRKQAGLFDVSHMGELLLSGEKALDTLQMLLSNDMAGMPLGSCRYSPMCNQQGGVVDDLIVYRLNEQEYLLVVNASNHEKDREWIAAHLVEGMQMNDISDTTAELALQGPAASAILGKLADASLLPEKYYTFTPQVQVADVSCLVSRTGYTGEDGYELYCKAEDAPSLWDALLDAGAEEGLVPCGLGARDTLRLEAAMPLYGHEMSDEITPLEAGIGSFVKRDKPDFIGKAALLEKGDPTRRRTGLRVMDRGIAREGAEVFVDGQKVGVVTSGTQLPYLGYAGAMALMDVAHREPGAVVEVDVRGRRLKAEVVKLPFYKKGQ